MSGNFKTEVGEFKGSKTIAITTSDDKRVITFGLSKAKAILESIDAIRAFVEQNDKGEKEQFE